MLKRNKSYLDSTSHHPLSLPLPLSPLPPLPPSFSSSPSKRKPGRPTGSRNKTHSSPDINFTPTIQKIPTTQTTSTTKSFGDTCIRCNRISNTPTILKYEGLCHRCIKRPRCTRCKDGEVVDSLKSHISLISTKYKQAQLDFKARETALTQQINALHQTIDVNFNQRYATLFQNSLTLLATVDPTILAPKTLPTHATLNFTWNSNTNWNPSSSSNSNATWTPNAILTRTPNATSTPSYYPGLQLNNGATPFAFTSDVESEIVDIVN